MSNKQQLPPDPEELNDDRAAWAGEALEAFQTITRVDEESVLIDLLADLMHWCDRNTPFPNGERLPSFGEALSMAEVHYEEETAAGPWGTL